MFKECDGPRSGFGRECKRSDSKHWDLRGWIQTFHNQHHDSHHNCRHDQNYWQETLRKFLASNDYLRYKDLVTFHQYNNEDEIEVVNCQFYHKLFLSLKSSWSLSVHTTMRLRIFRRRHGHNGHLPFVQQRSEVDHNLHHHYDWNAQEKTKSPRSLASRLRDRVNLEKHQLI